MLFDSRICDLGEGALWHPLRGELFWFDITGRRLLAHAPQTGDTRETALPEMCSAAGWIDAERLLVASETALSVLDIASETLTPVCPLEAENPVTRSNDGRADPWGGFWIGTMGKAAETGAGAIYRFAGDGLRLLFDQITIPNAICFAPDRSTAYFADTALGQVFRVALDGDGWPAAAPEVFLDCRPLGLNPDGAVTDADGALWIALWGAGAVIRVAPDGTVGARVDLPAPHATCPALGGADFTTLYCTSATQDMGAEALSAAPLSGATFAVRGAGQGRPEPAVILVSSGSGDQP